MTLEATEAQELARLRAWKAEALQIFDGLQDLGRALGIPLGVLVTGPSAIEAATELKARVDDAPRWVKRVEEKLQADIDHEVERLGGWRMIHSTPMLNNWIGGMQQGLKHVHEVQVELEAERAT